MADKTAWDGPIQPLASVSFHSLRPLGRYRDCCHHCTDIAINMIWFQWSSKQFYSMNSILHYIMTFKKKYIVHEGHFWLHDYK